jgi:hypothetical protein
MKMKARAIFLGQIEMLDYYANVIDTVEKIN